MALSLPTQLKTLDFSQPATLLAIFLPLLVVALLFRRTIPSQTVELPRPQPIPKGKMTSPFAVDPNLVLDPPKEDSYSPSELAQYDGSDPNKPVGLLRHGPIQRNKEESYL